MTLYNKYFNNVFLNLLQIKFIFCYLLNDIVLQLNFLHDNESHWIQLSKFVFLFLTKSSYIPKK